MHTLRRLARLAGRLGDARRPRAGPDRDPLLGTLGHSWDALQASKRRLGLAEDRGFTHCLPVLHEEIRLRVEGLFHAVVALRESPRPLAEPPSASDWVGELRALEAEFGDLEVDDRRCVLRVVTEPITLKGVELGPFALELVWSRFGQSRGAHCFDILALEAHPAAGRDRVTHPHVRDGTLCAGDAAAPIERALADGRLSDAFALVRGVLANYNPRSPYVGLDEWDGQPCSDCGDRGDRGETYYCDGCRSDYCEQCASCCRSCEETRCGGCLEPCPGCSEPTCAGCLDGADGGPSVCPDCRGTCVDCHAAVLRAKLDRAGLCDECASFAALVPVEPTPEPEETPCPATPTSPG